MKISLKTLFILATMFTGFQLHGFAFLQRPLITQSLKTMHSLSAADKFRYGRSIVTAGSVTYCFYNIWGIMNNFKKINNNLNVINNSLGAINNLMQGTLVSEAVVIGALMYKGDMYSKLWNYFINNDENSNDESTDDDQKKDLKNNQKE